MFDIGWLELLVIVVVAIVVVGPKDLPRLMRTFGHYAGKVRRMASDFQRQFDQAMTDSELEEMQRRYQEAVEHPERIKGPPMLPIPEEARSHPHNRPEQAGEAAAAGPAEQMPRPAAKKAEGRSTSRGVSPKRAASTGSTTLAKPKAPAKSAATPKRETAKAPPNPSTRKRAASKTAKPRGAGKRSGSKERSS